MNAEEIDRREFVYMWRLNFSTLAENWYPHPKGKDKISVKWIASLARHQLGYSDKTIDIDIVHTLYREYKKLISDELISLSDDFYPLLLSKKRDTGIH